MSTPTVSERRFADFCASAGIPCYPIERGSRRTPDFRVLLRDVEVICEIKQIEPNAEDLATLDHLDEGVAGRRVPKRLRRILKNVSPQLKSAARSQKPTLLVIYDITLTKIYTQDGEVLQAMFGRDSVSVVIPESVSEAPRVSDRYFGGDRGLSPTHNTSMSAIGILEGGPEIDTFLRVYHNPYAAVKLSPSLLDGLPVVQRVRPGDTTVRL